MKRIVLLVLASFAFALIFSSCGKDKSKARREALEKRLAQIRFRSDSLMSYSVPIGTPGGTLTYHRLSRKEIDSSTVSNSDVYLNSLVIGLVRTNFQYKDNDLVVEMAQFASPTDAYGFYSQVRPDGATLDSIGVESYLDDDTLRFTKVDYVVTITTNADSADSNCIAAIKEIGKKIDSTLKGSSRAPQLFILFPYNHKILPSQKFYSRNYLGVEGLDSVFTVDYAMDEDTLTLFLTFDTTGNKLVDLADWGAGFGKINSVPKELVFKSGHAESFTHPEYGQIVAGMINNKVAGVVNYNRPTGIELVPMWLKGIQ